MSDYSTIELTPELVFERISDFGSTPNSTLSRNSAGQSSLGRKGSSGSKTSPRRLADTLPRKQTFSPAGSGNTRLPSPTKTMEPRNDIAPRTDRGYYSLGSGVAKASKLNKATANKKGSDYGVAISIKGIQGQPFVILEDKEKHRHMVPAPDPSDSSDISSSNPAEELPNGTHVEPDGRYAAPWRAGTLNKDWRSKSDTPDLIRPARAKTNSLPPKTLNGPSSLPPANERLVKPSEVKAAQKPAPATLHMRSPRSRMAHERSRTLPGKRSDAATRSRSLSPNRAMAAHKPSRARSVSPPRNKNRGRRVDDNNTKPVSNLIGFFETGPQESSPKLPNSSLPVGNLLDRSPNKRSTPTRLQSPSPVSSYGDRLPGRINKSLKSPGFQRHPRSDNKEVEVTPDSRRSNLTVTTAAVPSKVGMAPAGRYFALTSPVATSPPVRTPPAYSSSQPSSRLGSLKRIEDVDAKVTKKRQPTVSEEPKKLVELKPVSHKPWQSAEKPVKTLSGVSAESLVKPSDRSSLFGPTEKRDSRSTKHRWQEVASKALVHEEEIVPKARKTVDASRYALPTDGRRSPALMQLVEAMVKHSKQEKALPRRKDSSQLATFLDLGVSTSKDKDKGRVRDVYQPVFEEPITPKNFKKGAHEKESSRSTTSSPGTVVSKARIYGPSHQLVRKTKRKRNAQRISTSNPGSRAVSGSEWSESEYSDAESLGMSLHITDDEEDREESFRNNSRSLPDLSSPVSFAESPKRAPSIVFGKITSQDTTKAKPENLDQVDGPFMSEQLNSSSSPSVAELQQHISELRKTVKELQHTADDNLRNYELLNELQSKLREVEKERSDLEREIEDGRKSIRDLERKLELAQNQISELRMNERHDRLVKQQQATELEDLKSQLNEMGDELDDARNSSDSKKDNESKLLEELHQLQMDHHEMLSKQQKRESHLLKREDELASLKKALREEATCHDEEVKMMKKMHEDVLSRLRDELDILRQENTSAVDAQPRLEEQLSSLRGELDRLKNQRHQERSWKRSSSSSDEGFDSSAASKVREEAFRNKELLLKSQEELRRSQTVSDQLRNEINLLQKKLAHAGAHREEYDDSEYLQKLTDDLSQVRQEKKNLEASVATIELQRSTLKGQVVEARAEREDGARQIRGLESETTRLKGRILELENEIERLKKELARSRRHLEAQVCDLELQMSDTDRRVSEMSTEKAILEKELSEAKPRDVDSTDSLLDALNEIKEQKGLLELALDEERKLADLREEEIEELTDELRRMSSSTAADAASESIGQLEEFKRRSAVEIDSLRSDIDAKARALREADRTNNKLQEELRRMDVELEEELNERESTVSECGRIERTLHELQTKMSEANREKEEKDRDMEKLQNMLSITEDDKLNLEEKLDASERQYRDVSKDLHNLREDVKDKEIEIEELKHRIKNAESSASNEISKIKELEHQNYVAEMQVNGLKEALESKHSELEDAEDKCRKMDRDLNQSEARYDETLSKLRDAERQRRLAAKEAEDLTIALSEKVALLDEAQRKLRRLESQMSEMDEASALATSFRLELDKTKRSHANELAQTCQELDEAKNALALSQRNTEEMEEEIRTWEQRYETAAGEALELERQRRTAAHLASEAQNEAREKTRAFAKIEDRLKKVDEERHDAEERAEKLADQLREADRKRKEAEVSLEDARSRLSDKERALKDAEKRVRRLHDEMEKSNNVDDETREVIKDLEDSRSEAQKEISKARDQVEELQHRLHEEEEKVDFLQERLNESDSALKKEIERSGDTEDEKRRLEVALHKAKEELEDKNKTLDQAQDAIRNIEEKMKRFETSHDHKANQLERMTSEKEKAQQKVNDLEKKIKEEKFEIERAEQLVFDTQRDVASVSSEDEAEDAQNRCKELEEELIQSNQEIEDLRSEVEELRSGVAEHREEEAQADKNCDALMSQVDLLQQEMKQRSEWSEKKQAELQKEIIDLERDLKSAEDDLGKTKEEKKNLEDQLATLERQDSDKQSENESSLRKEIQQLRDSLDDKTQQVYSAEDTIYRQKEVIEELTSIQQSTEKASLEQMDAYMAESDKQFEQLKSHLQEKSEQLQIAQQEKEGLTIEIKALSVEMDEATANSERTRAAHQEEQRRLEEVEGILEELRSKLKKEQKENSTLKEQLAESIQKISRDSDSDDEDEKSRLQDVVEEMTLKLQETEEEREETLGKLSVLEDKIGQLHNELEMEKSQVEVLQRDTQRQKQEIARFKNDQNPSQMTDDSEELVTSLKDKISELEEKLEQEANELKAINDHHQRTEMKLSEVLKQAETETNKANSEKEMMSVRMKSLKLQLVEAENQLSSSEEDRQQLQEELREQTEINYGLKQTLTALSPGSKAASASGSLFTSV